MHKFRVWDSDELYKNLKTAIQIKKKIQEIAIDNNLEMDGVPQSLVPTPLLYDLTVCYEAMYNKLLDYDLIKTGNFKTDKNNLH